MDLSLSKRPYPGHRTGQARPQAIPLSPALARGPRRVEIRQDAGVWPGSAGDQGARRSRSEAARFAARAGARRGRAPDGDNPVSHWQHRSKEKTGSRPRGRKSGEASGQHAGDLPPLLYSPGHSRRLSRWHLADYPEGPNADLSGPKRGRDERRGGGGGSIPALASGRTGEATEGTRQLRWGCQERPQPFAAYRSGPVIGIVAQPIELIAFCVVRLLTPVRLSLAYGTRRRSSWRRSGSPSSASETAPPLSSRGSNSIAALLGIRRSLGLCISSSAAITLAT